MKILLIQPYAVVPRVVLPYLPQEPLGLEYLATYLQGFSPGTEVRILDCVGEYWQQHTPAPDGRIRVGATNTQIQRAVVDFQPDLVGVSFMFQNQEEIVRSILAAVKAARSGPEVITIVGGCAASADPVSLMERMEDIDIIVMGEGEETLKELADPLRPIDRIKGVVYRAGGQVKTNEPRPYIAELDKIPIPNRRLAPFKAYSVSFMTSSLADRFRVLKPWLQYNRDWSTCRETLASDRAKAAPAVAAMIATRGCPYHCYFCSTQNAWHRYYRHRSVRNVITEMAWLHDEYSVRTFHFMDDNFNINENWVKDFCARIREIGWKIELRMQDGFFPRISRETLQDLKGAGLQDVFFGIESGSQRVLDQVIKKPVNLVHVKQIIAWCHEVGINVGGYFLIGMPGETLAEMQQTVDFALNSGLDRARLYTCQPLPGSQLYTDCVANGWLAEGYDPSRSLVVGPDFYIKTSDFTPEQVLSLANAGRQALRKKGLLYQRKS